MEAKARTGEFAFLRAVQSGRCDHLESHGRPRRPLEGTQTPSPGPKVAETHLVGDREHKQGNVYEMAGSARFDVVSGIPMVTAALGLCLLNCGGWMP